MGACSTRTSSRRTCGSSRIQKPRHQAPGALGPKFPELRVPRAFRALHLQAFAERRRLAGFCKRQYLAPNGIQGRRRFRSPRLSSRHGPRRRERRSGAIYVYIYIYIYIYMSYCTIFYYIIFCYIILYYIILYYIILYYIILYYIILYYIILYYIISYYTILYYMPARGLTWRCLCWQSCQQAQASSFVAVASYCSDCHRPSRV